MSTKELGQGLTRPPFNDEEKSLSVPPGVCSLPLSLFPSPNNVSSMTDLGFVATPETIDRLELHFQEDLIAGDFVNVSMYRGFNTPQSSPMSSTSPQNQGGNAQGSKKPALPAPPRVHQPEHWVSPCHACSCCKRTMCRHFKQCVMCQHWAGKHSDNDSCYQFARRVDNGALVPVCICCVNVAVFRPRAQPDIPPRNKPQSLTESI